jgi:hypothetical protein
MIRPELAARLRLWHESAAAVAVVLAGLWLISLGGWLLQPVGALVAALGAGWLVIALRRLRFARPVEDPGMVDLDEGQIGYFGAGQGLGGYVALEDLAEIRLLSLRGRKHWRLKSRDGAAILIPVAAHGAGVLYDAFASLPGIDMGALAAALDRDLPAQSLWKRAAPGPTDRA